MSLSDNEKTGFKARELKSVQVDAVGCFLKLNIHKNHINKHNLYNQVSCMLKKVFVSLASSRMGDIGTVIHLYLGVAKILTVLANRAKL